MGDLFHAIFHAVEIEVIVFLALRREVREIILLHCKLDVRVGADCTREADYGERADDE